MKISHKKRRYCNMFSLDYCCAQYIGKYCKTDNKVCKRLNRKLNKWFETRQNF